MWQAGGLGFAHAVATPYRDKRSHFDGQDILEAGSGLDVPDHQIRDGWLNRLVQALPGTTSETAFAIGLDQLKVISGSAPVRQWTPDTRIDLDAQSRRLLERHLRRRPAVPRRRQRGLRPRRDHFRHADMGGANKAADAPQRLAAFAADRLREETRIAAFSINGWDTHREQARRARPAG